MAETQSRVTHRVASATTRQPHGQLADEALVDAIAQEDPAALAEAYTRHGSRVHALARALCGSARAEDLTQEIFLQLWNNPQRYEPDRGSLRSYLLVQAHARAVDVLRSDNARTGRETRQNLLARPESPDTEAAALSRIARAEIEALVTALPVSERHPIVLAYFGGHTYREVARILGVPEGTVKGRIRSGLTRLRAASGTVIDLT